MQEYFQGREFYLIFSWRANRFLRIRKWIKFFQRQPNYQIVPRLYKRLGIFNFFFKGQISISGQINVFFFFDRYFFQRTSKFLKELLKDEIFSKGQMPQIKREFSKDYLGLNSRSMKIWNESFYKGNTFTSHFHGKRI